MPFIVHVEDFQSLADVTVEVAGFTVITGTNNAGKTALMRAIRGAFQNTRGTSFIRRGKTKAVVEITFDGNLHPDGKSVSHGKDDGRKLRWEKGKSAGDKPTYVIDGGNPIYPGQAVPDEVRALGVKPITVGGREIWPQFAPQFNGQIFLLDQPGSVLAEAVSDVNHVAQLNEALRLAESDKRSAASELKIRLAEQGNLEIAAKRFDGLDGVETTIVALEDDYAKAQRFAKALENATILKNRLNMAQEGVSKLEGVASIDIPDMEPAKGMLAEIGIATRLHERLAFAQEAVSKLDGVTEIDIPDTNTIEEISMELDDVVDLYDRLVSARSAVEKLDDIPDLVEIDTDVAKGLRDDLVYLTGLQERQRKSQESLSSVKEEAAKIDADLETVVCAIRDALDGLGECPLCGSLTAHSHDGAA
jgi:DNA repair ATPase RecN